MTGEAAAGAATPTTGPATPTVGAAVRAATAQLRAAAFRSPRLDAELLMSETLGGQRIDLLRRPERELTAAEGERFSALLGRRLAREPIAYLLGRRAFRTIELEVTPAVLIPRPETETLVDVALAVLAERAASHLGTSSAAASVSRTSRSGHEAGGALLQVADVGTGSGCIALALAAEHPRLTVTAIDVDEAALALAAANARRLSLERRVTFARSDLFAAVPAGQRFDLIVSNPPYVAADEYEQLEPNVRDYEPRLALLAGADGLEIYRRLVPAAAEHLRPGGHLVLEVGRGQAAAVTTLIAATGSFAPAAISPDLAGIERVVAAQRLAPAGGEG